MLLLMSLIVVNGARSAALELLLGNNAQHTAQALVRVHLLVRTNANAVSSGAQAYYFNNAQQVAVDDGQIRREYSVTVALRNPT